MNGAPRPHHRNIYCIIYSASPLVQGERTHINFQPHSSPPHSSSCLLLKAEVPARSLPFFHSFFFFFRSFSLLFFLPRCGTGSIHRGPEALTQSGLPAVDDLHSPLSLFFYLLTCFSVFFLFCYFFSYNWSNSILPKDYKQELTGICGMHSQFLETYSSWIYGWLRFHENAWCSPHQGKHIYGKEMCFWEEAGYSWRETLLCRGSCRTTLLQQQHACCTIGLIQRQRWMCRWCKRWWTTKRDKERERGRAMEGLGWQLHHGDQEGGVAWGTTGEWCCCPADCPAGWLEALSDG